MKSLEDQMRRAHVWRWAVFSFVSSVLLIGAGSFAIQSHFYQAAMSDVRTLSKSALVELKGITEEIDEHRGVDLRNMEKSRDAARAGQFKKVEDRLVSVESKIDAILTRLQ